MISNNRKPNLVIFITTLRIGGAETVLFRSVEMGAYDEFNLYVVSLKDVGFYGKKLERLGINVIPLNLHKVSTFLLGLLKYLYIFFVIKPKVVHGWMYHANILALLFAKIRFKPVCCIFSIRHSLETLSAETRVIKLVIWMNAILSKYTDLILFNSHVSKEEHKKYGFKSNILKVIPNGFDTKVFKKSHAFRERYRDKYSIPKDTLIIGHIGRLNYLKNQELLVDSFAKLLDFNHNIRLFLVGRGIVEYGEFCKKHYPASVIRNIYFLDEVDNVNELMSAFDIFCLPSRSEGFPNVLAEAMSCSLPCISTACGDTKIIIDDQKWIVEQNDSDQLITKLQEMICLSQISRENIGLKNRDKIKKYYEKERINDMFKSMLNDLNSDKI